MKEKTGEKNWPTLLHVYSFKNLSTSSTENRRVYKYEKSRNQIMSYSSTPIEWWILLKSQTDLTGSPGHVHTTEEDDLNTIMTEK